MFGACCNTFPAGDAIVVVDLGNTVFDIQCVEFTGGNTITKSEATVSTGVRTRKEAGCGCAVRCTGVEIAFVCFFTRALAEYIGYDGDDGFGCDTEFCGDGGGDLLAASGTKSCVFLGSIRKHSCVCCTTAIPATATICAGKNILQCFGERIDFHAEEAENQNDDDSADKGDSRSDNGRYENCIDFK